MAVSMRQTNPGWEDSFLKRLTASAGKEVAVGYPVGESGTGSPHYKNGTSVLEVATWNNEGAADGVPERPFMELAAKNIQAESRKIIRDKLPAVLRGEMPIGALLEELGTKGAEQIRDAIENGSWAPNSPETIRRKKSEMPLIDSHDMSNTATHAVRDRAK